MKPFRSPHRPKKSSLVAGRQQIIDAMENGKALERIYLQQNLSAWHTEELVRAADLHRVPVNRVPIEKLNSFNVENHEGAIAIYSRIRYQDLQNIISFVVEGGRVPLFVILDGVTDIRNIGGIARTAYCMGVQALIIPDKGVGTLNEDAILTSAGALEKLPVCRVSSLMKAVDELHLNGIKVLGSEMEADTKIYDVNFTEPVAIIMGSEEKGIYPALLKQCDKKFFIPMSGGFESLNVSVATGMILYEAMKQRSLV